jgi:predicted nucleic acid-binding protein
VILVDTSVWIDHFRRRSARLSSLLEEGRVLTHPFVIGELACGLLADRRAVLGLLAELPSASVATDVEVMDLIERRSLAGRGIGFVDAHLLASAMLEGVLLWTLDRRLAASAVRLGLGDA